MHRAPSNRRFIRVAGGSNGCIAAGEESVLFRVCNNGQHQQWIIESHEAGVPGTGIRGIRLRGVRNPAACIDNDVTAKTRLWECNTALQQQWNITSPPLISSAPGRVVEASGRS